MGRRVKVLAGSAVLVLATGLTSCATGDPAPSASTTPTPTSSSTPTPSSAAPSSGTPSTSSAAPSPTLTGFATTPVTGGAPVTVGDLVGISRVAVGRHDGYDRFVVEIIGAALPPYEVTPQDSPVFVRDPRGDEVRLDGDAGVLVVLRDVDVLRIPYDVDSTPGYPAIREVALTGAFEGVVAYGIGVDGPGAVRVTTMRGPVRLVIDVIHPSTGS